MQLISKLHGGSIISGDQHRIGKHLAGLIRRFQGQAYERLPVGNCLQIQGGIQLIGHPCQAVKMVNFPAGATIENYILITRTVELDLDGQGFQRTHVEIKLIDDSFFDKKTLVWLTTKSDVG